MSTFLRNSFCNAFPVSRPSTAMTFSVKALNLSTKVALPIKSRVCLVVQYLKNERILSEGSGFRSQVCERPCEILRSTHTHLNRRLVACSSLTTSSAICWRDSSGTPSDDPPLSVPLPDVAVVEALCERRKLARES